MFTYDWYNGSPADYPLVTEVNPGAGFLEITHYGTKPADLSGWTVSASGREWAIPKGTMLTPGKPLVLVADKSAFQARFGPTVTPVELPGLTLGAPRDTVRLRKGATLIDTVAWGEALPGWKLPAGAVCRSNPGKDTNSHLDWTLASKGTPGAAGCGL